MNLTVIRLKTALQSRKTLRIRVYGNSMNPTINEGDIVQAKEIKREIKVDDIVLLEHNGKLVCHRIYEIQEGGRYRTKGDNNILPDSIITNRENILAFIRTELEDV